MLSKAKKTLRKIFKSTKLTFLAYPRNVKCNICDWEGRHFMSDSWHKYINCPKCGSGIRQRLFYASLQYIKDLSYEKLFQNKSVLNFAPEVILSNKLRIKTYKYVTADYQRPDCDLKLDMSDMPQVKNESFDVVVAFDVLEHVPDYRKALKEVHRILTTNGVGIFTIPQKDNLKVTYEDSSIVTPEERKKHFGQFDHLRIFGDDFAETLQNSGFSVTVVDKSMFSDEIIKKHILFPSEPSTHPLATNHRKVYFAKK
jgi:SAM-dependent methyltransferase